MVDTQQITRIFKEGIKRFKKSGVGNARNLMQPTRDWKIILLVFILLNAAIVIFSTYLFLQINKGEIFLVEPTQSSIIDTVDRDLLSETIFLFEEKSRQFEKLKKNKPTLVDPSL